MPVIGATTVHGNAVVAGHPAGGALRDVEGRAYTAVVGYRHGAGATYEGTGDWNLLDTWFHIPIPTLNVLTLPGVPLQSGGRIFLERFFVLFEAVNCAVRGIQAWDNKQRFFNAPYPSTVVDEGMGGDWSVWGKTQTSFRGVTLTNLWSPREGDPSGRHAMMSGLGISILVDFTGGGDPRRITFFGAGADWADRPVG